MKRIETADEFFAAADESEGRTGAARIRRFAAAVERGEPPAAEDMTAIATAFRAILGGADPKKALSVEGKKGRPRKTEGLDIAVAVERLIRAGMTPGLARGNVCNEHDIEEDTVRRALKRHGEVARGILDMQARDEKWRQLVDEAVRIIEQDRRRKSP